METPKELNSRTMAKYGLLIDYQWCTGCHSCEIACQMEHKMPVGKSGILVHDMGHWPIEEGGDEWQLGYLAAPTTMCDGCEERRALGKVPTCVQHCQAQCMDFGPIDEMAEKAKAPNFHDVCRASPPPQRGASADHPCKGRAAN